jgi:two-component system chemotaxis sensor kinase CheA
MNELSQDQALIQDFLTECEELLQQMEQDLLALESAHDPELLHRIFRAMHTIKGTSSFLGFDQLVELAHKAEDLLNDLRKSNLAAGGNILDLLLRVSDRTHQLLNGIRSGDNSGCEIESLVAELARARENFSQPPAAAATDTQAGIAAPIATPTVTAPVPEAAPENSAPSKPATSESSVPAKPAADAQPAAAEIGTPPSPAAPSESAAKAPADLQMFATMRVDVRKLDYLVDLVGELVLERNRLAQLNRDLSSGRIGGEQLDEAMSQSTARLSFVTDELQRASLSTRMVPIETLFRKLPRMVRDLANTLDKKVELTITGQDTEIDKTMIEHISDPLVHLIRNCLDHGIERQEVRQEHGKPATGQVSLDARQEGDQIVVTITDDGAGIDPDRVLAKAIEKGMLTAEAARLMSPKEILEVIFLPGFSTAQCVTNVSGRGVGMDVVRTNIKKLNGSVGVESRFGEGTSVILKVPLTMAILPVLMVEVSSEIYAIPLRTVLETLRIHPQDIHRVEEREVLRLRDRTVPLIRLSDSLGLPDANDHLEVRRVVILALGDLKIALLVDRLLGQESTVIKPLGLLGRDCPAIAGATISGDGRVRLVIDPAELVRASAC